ncbi:MAG: hypothetical protein WCW26_00770 [Candidatus Buchananbacteria bacterium]
MNSAGAEEVRKPPIGDDEFKRTLGMDHDRCNGAYEVELPETGELQRRFAANYLEPGGGEYDVPSEALEAANREMTLATPRIKQFLGDRRLVMVVPMRENGDVTRPLLSTVTKLMPSDCITIVNHDSDDDALQGVMRFSGVHLPYWKDLLDTIDWLRLLPILNLTKRPEGFGKGLSVLAGYLHRYFLAQIHGAPQWLCQHDAEIQQYERYRALEFLVWGLLERPDAQYAKMAKFGRTNERCMLARTLLNVLAQSNALSDPIRQRCSDMFYRLVPDKWMLTGEFVMSWELAMTRPFASGYLEETLTAMFAQDKSAQNGRTAICVANPNSRLDAANDDGKEAKMQQEISAFVLRMALSAPPVDQWTVDTIADLNREVMSQPNMFGWIPSNDHSVVAEVLPANRIIPSIQMLVDGGFVDTKAGLQLVSA